MARFHVRGLFRRPTQDRNPPSDSSCARRRFCLHAPHRVSLVGALLALTLPVICCFSSSAWAQLPVDDVLGRVAIHSDVAKIYAAR